MIFTNRCGKPLTLVQGWKAHSRSFSFKIFNLL